MPFDVTVGQIDYLISFYALGMAIGGSFLTALLLALRTPNKLALLWLLLLYVASGVLVGGLSILSLALLIFALFAQNAIASIGAFVAIGLTGVALNPAMVARVMRAASPGPLVNTMHSSVITAGLALGSWAGGYAINSGFGLRSPLWVGVFLALCGLLTLIPYLRGREPAAITS